jgi:Lrp/AsnC family transcriptional regulator, regulator for asnA, asnC and gidA
MAKIDEIDIQIANLLVEDGRMSSAEIARRIGGLSERAARYRIERMIRDSVIQVRAVANPQAIGYNIVADVWLQVEPDAIRDVAQKMIEYGCVAYVAYSIGETDISVQVVGRDTAEVYRFVTEVIGPMPGVRKTTTSIVPRVLKGVYQWRLPMDACLDQEEIKNSQS